MRTRSEKEQLIGELTRTLREAPGVVVASFRTLVMADAVALRRVLRPVGGNLRVVKKRLFRKVLAQLHWPASFAETVDSVVVAWGPDPVLAAKSLHDFVQRSKSAALLGGVQEGALLDPARLALLASLPARSVLEGQLVSVVAGPLRGLVGVFTHVLRRLPLVLRERLPAAPSAASSP